MDSQVAQKTWEMSNNVETISSIDDIYRYDKKQQQDMLTTKPWEKEYVAPLNVFIAIKLYLVLFLSCRHFGFSYFF